MNRNVKFWAHGGLVAIATLMAILATVKVFTNYRVAQQVAISEKHLAKYPPQITSATGQQIDRLLATMGLGTVGDSAGGAAGDAAGSQTVEIALQDYFIEVSKLESGPLPPLPTPITEHLTRHTNGWQQLQTVLRTQPSWAFDPEAGASSEPGGPHYKNIVLLHHYLLAQSILAQQAGDRAGQEASFNAAHTLTQSMAASPSLMAHGFMHRSLQADIAVARHANLDLAAVDYGTPLIKVAALDTHLWYTKWVKAFRQTPLMALSSIGHQQYLALPFKDFLLLTQTNEQKLHDRFFQQLTPANLCTVNGASLPQSYGAAPYAVPLPVFHSSVANALSMELNGLVTKAKQTYRDTGSWPTILSSADSQVCSTMTWHYKVLDQADSITITLDGSLPWLDPQDPPLPLRYTLTSAEVAP